MLYDNYKSKILIIAKVWETIKRFRILILSCLLAVTATVTGLLIAKGAIYGDKDCPAEITYGETLDYGAGAFMGDITYEYCAIGTDEWSANPPTRPGDYKVRVVSKGAFGGRREGEEHEFTITARNVLVSVVEDTIVYGELPTVESDAAETDVVVCAEFEYIGVGTEEIEVAPVAESITITNADGADVTECYSIEVEFTPISFEKRPITVTAGSASRNYDGTALNSNEFTVTEGSVAEDDEINVTCNGTITTVGFTHNVPTVQLFNADGIDVTQYYQISAVNGTLSVGQRPVLIESASAEQVYNGTPFSKTEFDEDGAYAQLVEGHRLIVTGGAQITDVGRVQNTLTMQVHDAAGNDVTANYAVSYAETSILTVLPRPITVVSLSDTQVYNGEPFTKSGYTLAEDTSLAFGEELHGTYTGSITNVGTAENTFTVREIINNGRNVTHNYDITLVFGTLEVMPRAITITTETHAKEYDGEKFSATNATADDLVTGHTLHMLDFTEITYVSENMPNNNRAEYGVLNGNEDVTGNYDISYNFGTLTIKPRQIEIAIVNQEKIYDGTPLISAETHITCVDGREWPAGHTWSVQTHGSQTDVGTSDNVFGRNANGSPVMIVNRLELSPTQNLAENFEVVSTTDGTLTVTPRQVLLTSASADFVYADSEYTVDEVSVSGEREWQGIRVYPLVSGHSVVTSGWGSITDVGTLDNVFTAQILNANEEDISYNYEIFYNYGTVEVHKRKVKIQIHSYTWIYDGEAHYDGDGAPNEYNQSHEYTFDDCVEERVTNDIDSFHKPVEGHTLFMISPSFYRNVTYKQLDNGEYDYNEVVGYPNEVVFAIRKDGVAQGNNYDISYIDGTITILPRPLSLVSGSDSKIYDGTALTCESYGFVSGSLALNHQIEAFYTGEQTNAYTEGASDGFGESVNTFSVIIWDENDQDVTINYDLDLQYGTLKVFPRLILVNRHEYSIMYNAEPHHDDWVYSNDDLTIIDGEYYPLADGQFFQEDSYTNTVTNWGDSGRANDITLKVAKYNIDGDIENVTRNYTIEYQGGSLSITQRPIKIITRTLEWTYDDEAHWDRESYTAQDLFVDNIFYYTLIEGHWLNATGQSQVWWANATPQGEIYQVNKNLIDFRVIGDTEGINDNYAITVEYGDLIVKQREISIMASGGMKTYDATPLVVNAGDWIYEFNSPYELVDGHELTVETTGAERTDVGTTYNKMTVGSAVITKEGYGDVTANYLISYYDSFITILSRPLYINTHSHEWVYDANAHYDDCEYDNDDLTEGLELVDIARESYYLVDGHRLVMTSHTEITNHGTKFNTLTFKVVDENGNDIHEGNYEYFYNEGTLTIHKRPVDISTFSQSWVYDGEWHTNQTIQVEHNGAESGIVGSKHTWEIDISTKIRDVGTAENHITISVWEGITDVTENYRFIEVAVGQLEITPRPIYINVHSHTDWIYDGYPHMDDCQYTNADLFMGWVNGTEYLELVGDHTLLTVEKPTITNAGEIANALTFIVQDSTGNPVTDNYTLVYNDDGAILKILPREITINLHDCVWIYDGQAHCDGDLLGEEGSANAYTRLDVSDTGYSLPDEHTIEIVSVNTIENVNAIHVANECTVRILNQDGEWIEGNFIISYNGGSLTVLPRDVTLYSATDGKVYDGEPLTNSTVTVVWNLGRLEGHEVIGAIANGSQTDIGASKNTIADGYQIVNAEGTIITGNYNVIQELGWLTVYDPNEIVRSNITVQPVYYKGVYPGAQSITHSGELIEGYLQDLTRNGYTYEVEMDNTTQVGLGLQTVSISYFAVYDANGNLIAQYDNGEWLKESYLYNFILETNRVRLCANFELQPVSLTGIYPETQSLTHTGEVEELFNVDLMLAEGYTYEVEVEEKELLGRGMVEVRIMNFTLYDPNGETIAVYENFVWKQEHDDYDIRFYDGYLQIATQVTIQPISMEGIYPETQSLTHTGEIEPNFVLDELIAEGYTYELEVEETRQIGPGITEVNVKSFKLWEPDGTLAIHYEINEEPFVRGGMYIFVANSGTLRITENLVTIHLGEKTKVYDGTPLAYDETDEWWTVAWNSELGVYEEVDLSDTVTVLFDLSGIPSIQNVGEGFDEDVARTCVTVYDAEMGEDITSQYTINFDTVNFAIEQRTVLLATASAQKEYDGTPLTAHEIIFRTGGLDGHTATANFLSSRTEGGTTQNKIEEGSLRIFDTEGNDVTDNFAYTLKLGWLTILEE